MKTPPLTGTCHPAYATVGVGIPANCNRDKRRPMGQPSGGYRYDKHSERLKYGQQAAYIAQADA
ncbi:hypothetical protein, partial [Enterobacter intestinihominis]